MTDMNARKLLILTFDDGPSDEYTPRVLTALEKVNGRATFSTGTHTSNEDTMITNEGKENLGKRD